MTPTGSDDRTDRSPTAASDEDRAGVAALLAAVAVSPAGDGPDGAAASESGDGPGDRDGIARFVGAGSDNDGVDATYGGHLLGQAVSAALATVEPDRRLHSLHGYFLRAGRPGEPYHLEVDRVRDGRSFCTRRVRVFQDEGRVQFELLASCALDEDGPEYSAPAGFDLGAVPGPESLPTYAELMDGLDPLPLPEPWVHRPYGLDIRTVNAPWAPDGLSDEGGIRLWIRAKAPLPDDHHLQSAVLAHQSDESLADTVPARWGATWGSPDVVFVSLDHAMWFHRPFDLNDWLLVDQRPVTVGRGRGLAVGTVWNRAGEPVVTVNQEVLIRLGDEAG